LYQRYIYPKLIEALTDTPAVLIHGPRQCGKTTLAQLVGEKQGYEYLTFDDDVLRAAAKADPIGFVSDLPTRVIIDEVQRVPEIFRSLKKAIDKNRIPGRFILTGSANVLLLPQISDSLAGRLEIMRLHPLSQAELTNTQPWFLDQLFRGELKQRTEGQRLGKKMAERIVRGGFPPALSRSSSKRATIWYRDYIETLIQRDIQDLAIIHRLDILPRLLSAIAVQSAGLLNVTELSSPFQVSRPTIREYLTLLSGIFLVDELGPWYSNRLNRLIKTPKIHLGDPGLGAALLGMNEDSLWENRPLFGKLFETYGYQELRRQASWYDFPITFSHFRDKDQVEVDLVLESGGKIAAVELKATSTIKSEDFKGLRKLRDTVSEIFTAGVIIYDGTSMVSFGDRLWAVPICLL
jgi:predicted AAA+ superfamily ATPase